MSGAARTPGPSGARPQIVFLALAGLFVLGALVPLDPDFDVTFGIEAWRRPGALACVASAVVVLALLREDRLADRVAAGAGRVARAIPAVARMPVVLAVACAAFVLLPDASLSGDAMEHVDRVARRDAMPSNVVVSWLHFAVASAGADPLAAVRSVSIAAGLGGVAAAVALGRALFDDAGRRAAVTVLASTTGAASLWFGSLEVYAPLGAAVLAYVTVGVHVVRGRAPVAAAAAVLGGAFVVHGAAGLLLPSLVVLAWTGADRGASAAASSASRDGADPGVSNVGVPPAVPVSRRVARVGVALGVFAVPVAVVAGVLWFVVWDGHPPATGPARWGNFLGAGGDGPVLPLVPDDALRARYALLDAEHALAALSTLFVAAPAAWFLLAVGREFGAPLRSSPPDATREPAARHVVVFAVAALAPWVAFTCVWNVSYGLRRDWDLCSATAFPAVLLASALVLRHPLRGGDVVRVAAVALFTFVPLVVTHAGTRIERRNFALAADWTLRGAAGSVWADEATRLDPTGTVARIDEGERLLESRQPAAALAVLSAARTDDPDDIFVREPLARALEALGRFDEARAEYVAALDTPRENLRFRARMGLARLAVRAGDAAVARRQIERALREDSENPLAGEARRHLR